MNEDQWRWMWRQSSDRLSCTKMDVKKNREKGQSNETRDNTEAWMDGEG